MNIHELATSPELQSVGWALLHSLWQGAVVGLVLLGLLRLARRRGAGLRYGLACVALASLLALPVATGWFVLGVWEEHEACWEAAGSGVIAADHPLARVCGGHGMVVERLPSAPTAGHPDQMAATESYAGPGRVEMMSVRLSGAVGIAAAMWLLGVMAMAARLGAGWVGLRRLRARGLAEVEPELRARIRGLSLSLGVRAPVEAAYSGAVDVPTVVGWRRPMLLLPPHAVHTLEPRQVDAVLLHELGHVRRHDPLVNLVQCVFELLLFYHPVARWVSQRIREERECCCDEIAADLGPARAAGYLRALVTLEALRTRPPRRHALALTGGALLPRVRRLVDREAGGPPRARLWQSVGVGLLGAALLCLPLLDTTSAAGFSSWVVMTRDLQSRPDPEGVELPEPTAAAELESRLSPSAPLP